MAAGSASAASLDICGVTVLESTCTSGVIRALPGQSISIQISGSGFNNQTSGGDFQINFDPNAFTLTNFVVTNPPFDTSAINDTDVATGTINRVDVFKSTTGNVGPTFNVATLTFDVKSLGNTGSNADMISLAGSLVGWFEPDAITAYDVSYGSLQVSAVPAPAAVWLLATGIGGLVVRRWRKVA
ncbi:MAG: PEP-CTERM sorting domain-containing protein [Gammaproteobacteria bacterium]